MPHANYKHFTLGIEEEYMVMDPQTRELKSHEQKIVLEGQKVIKGQGKSRNAPGRSGSRNRCLP
jgi:carboxylate-amine ligase